VFGLLVFGVGPDRRGTRLQSDGDRGFGFRWGFRLQVSDRWELRSLGILKVEGWPLLWPSPLLQPWAPTGVGGSWPWSYGLAPYLVGLPAWSGLGAPTLQFLGLWLGGRNNLLYIYIHIYFIIKTFLSSP
jgi:hypothetical protein